jgi:hypothetical protein
MVMCIQVVFPVLIILALPFIPETPRFLAMKGKHEEALKVMKMLRRDEKQAEAEIAEIEATLERKVETGTWMDLVRGSNLRRTIISITIPSIEAWQGQSFVSSLRLQFSSMNNKLTLGETIRWVITLSFSSSVWV